MGSLLRLAARVVTAATAVCSTTRAGRLAALLLLRLRTTADLFLLRGFWRHGECNRKVSGVMRYAIMRYAILKTGMHSTEH